MLDGGLMEYSEDEIITCSSQMTGKGPMKSNFKQNLCNSHSIPCLALPMETQNEEANSHIAGPVEDLSGSSTKCALDMEEEHSQSVFLQEQKNEEVSSNIDIPHVRKSEEEVDMDKVTAAMVLTSLSTSPLIQNLPVKLSENGSWKEGGITPSSHSSSGFWSWSAPSDQSNPCTPSPPLSADSSKPFRMPSGPAPADDIIDEPDGSSLLLDEPIPRKRKNSMKVMFKCLWKNCGKVLSSAAGIQKHIRTTHLGRNCDSECSDGEEDFYYTEIKLNTDSMAEGSNGPCPVAHAPSLSQPPASEPRCPDGSAKSEDRLITPLSRSAPSTLYLVHTDHAYQATAPVTIYSSANLTPNRSTSLSISWQSPPVTFTGRPASPTDSCVGQRSAACTILASPPRATSSLRKSRGEGKKCRKVYGMENRDMWCTACRWKKACQRFVD